jgi:hypothetical protein
MIRPRSFYLLSLSLPLVVPALLAALLRAGFTGRRLESAFSFTASAVWVGGLAYLPVVVGYSIWMRGKSERELKRASFLAPPIMLAIGLLELGAVFLVNSPPPESGMPTAVASLATCVLVLGYGYVLLAHVLLFVAKRLRWVGESARESA